MMLTRCPACQTVFRLQPEQLHARRGEVRCGHCFHPFNALENEVVTPAGRSARADAPASSATTADTVTPQAPTSARSADDGAASARDAEAADKVAAQRTTALDFEIPEGPELEPSTAAAEDGGGDDFDLSDFPDVGGAAPGTTSPAPSGPARTVSPASTPGVIRSGRRTPAASAAAAPAEPAGPAGGGVDRQAEGVARVEAGAESSAPPPPDGAADEVEAELGAEAPAADNPADSGREPLISAWAQKQTTTAHPARVDKADAPKAPAAHIPRQVDVERLDSVYGRPPKPVHPLLRTLAGLGVGLLAGTLAAQAIYLFRVEISRELPGLRPLLVAACAELGCDVPLPRQAEHIGIEASELQSEPGRAGRYTLHVTLKNRADYPIEWPHLELTLTDAGDTPITRRVITPQEWVPLERRRSGFSARDTLSVRLPFDNSGPSPTGYRVYVFYP